jgi:hypothetical protein
VTQPHENHGELPAPIPWLAAMGPGPVAPLDRVSPAPTAAPKPVAEPTKGSCGSSCGCKTTAAPAKNPPISQSAPAQATAAVAPGAPAAKPKKAGPKRPGSGIPARKVIQVLVWVRRFAQVFFLALFLYFLFQTAFRGTFSASSDQPVRLPLPVEAFLLADPFVAAMTLLSTHTVYRGLAWSLAILALTVVFGRVFCGWICPFGTLHHFFGWIFPSRYLKGGKRVEANKTHTWQRGKYYLMYGFLGAALVGSAIGGLFDPICVAVRAVGLGVVPALQYLGIRG